MVLLFLVVKEETKETSCTIEIMSYIIKNQDKVYTFFLLLSPAT